MQFEQTSKHGSNQTWRNMGIVPVVFLMLLLLQGSQAQAAPAWQANSNIAASTGADVTVTLPAHAADDVLLLQVVVRDTDDTITWPAGWTQIAAVDRGTTARYLWAWKRATSSAETNPLVDKSTTTGDTYAAVTTYRGAITTGDPWDVIGTANTATAAAHTLNGIATTTANSLIIASLCGEDNTAASGTTFTATAPASLTQVLYDESNTGGDGACTAGAATTATAGATGDVVATWTGTVVGSGGIVLALKPAAAGASSQVAFAQQPSDTQADSIITPAITVQIQDSSGNIVTTATDTVTIAIGADPSGGVAVLSGTLAVAAVSGVATFSDLTVDTGGTAYTLTASATGLTGATSSSFNINTPAGTYGATECAATRFGTDLVCTAQDVSITGIAIASGGPTSCVGGQSVTLDLDVTVNFATPDRWDVGLFLSNDGKTPELLQASGGASSCTVAVLPTASPFMDLDPGPWDGVTDTCGDGNSTIGGGSGSGVARVNSVPVSCQAVDLSGGKLFIPFLTSWDNQSSPSGSTCTSNLNPVPNTKSKCNVPDGAVEADVLKSTVRMVVLPAISKTDGIATITAGDSTAYTVVITNTTGATLSSAIFKDPAVTYLTVDSVSCSNTTGGASCPLSGDTTVAAMQGGGIVIPSMPVDSSVTFTVGTTVSSDAPAGAIVNTAYVVVSGESNSADDTNNVITKLPVSKSFVPSSTDVGGLSVLTITLRNNNLAAATGVTFTDNYPADLFNAATPNPAISGSGCTGTLTAGAGDASFLLAGGTIPVNTTCTYTVNVTSAVSGAYYNSTGDISSNEYTGEPASASLAVGASNLSTSTKSWQDLDGGESDPGDTIRYTITLMETAGIAAVGVSVSDTIPAALTGMTVVSCPSGASCSVSGQTFTASDITVPASGSTTIVFDATIAAGTAPGTSINNCASVTNSGGVGAAPCATTITVSPSAVAGSGNKPLYLYDGASSYKLSRVKPASQSSVTITKSSSQLFALSPALATAVTISPSVTPLAIIPVNLYLAGDTASESRTVQVQVSCSGGGATYTETKIFDGTAVNNPYLSTTPTLVSFNNLTISADQTCSAGQTWNLTVSNNTTGNGTRNVIVYPTSGGNNSYISLPSRSIINVDSVNSYDAAYPAVTSPTVGYFAGGRNVYVRAEVSDPFGSFDITSATVTIKDPYDLTVVSDADMTQVADSGSAARTYEYVYLIPGPGPAGYWTATVTAKEGTEDTVSDSGAGGFNVGMPNLTIVKTVMAYSDPINGTSSPKAIPGSFMLYNIMVINSGNGAVDNNTTVVADQIPANTELYVGDIAGSGPIVFTDGSSCSAGTAASGLCYDYANPGACSGDNLEFSNTAAPGPYVYGYTPTPDGNGCDAGVTNLKITFGGPFNGTAASGGSNTSFCLQFRVRVK